MARSFRQVIDGLPRDDARRYFWAKLLVWLSNRQYADIMSAIENHRHDSDYDEQTDIVRDEIIRSVTEWAAQEKMIGHRIRGY